MRTEQQAILDYAREICALSQLIQEEAQEGRDRAEQTVRQAKQTVRLSQAARLARPVKVPL